MPQLLCVFHITMKEQISTTTVYQNERLSNAIEFNY